MTTGPEGRADGAGVGRHLLGPHTVGRRIVIRRLTGGRGPSGAPETTDLLGECLSWADGTALLRLADGREVAVPHHQIVSGKPVPPRPSVRLRVSPREAQVRALAVWPDLHTAPLGDWLLRWSDGFPNRRANSVLAFGPAEVPDAVARAAAHYRGLGRRPIAAVLADSDEERELVGRGWAPESTDADSLFQLAGVAAARRALTERPSYAVTLEEDGHRVTARIGEDASGVAAYADDWVGLRALQVAPDRRRRGLGLAIVGALLDWGAEQGATTVHLQVLADNAPALALYERLGFGSHHAYRYLAC